MSFSFPSEQVSVDCSSQPLPRTDWWHDSLHDVWYRPGDTDSYWKYDRVLGLWHKFIGASALTPSVIKKPAMTIPLGALLG